MPTPPAAPTAQMLGRIRLRHLQCFLAVARLGTLRAAAQALSVTQPAVTKTINELEDLLGVRLFARGRHGALPTPEAELFLPHASASVNALALALDSVAHGPGAVVLRIGVLPTVAPFFARVLCAWEATRSAPTVAVRVHGGRNTQLIEALRARELDAVVGRLSEPEAMVGVTFEHLYAEPMWIVARPGHPLLHSSEPPSAAALSACPMVLPLAGTLIRQLADGFMTGRGIAAQAGLVETLDTAFARALVLLSDHLWFTPAGAARVDVAAGTLARLPLDVPAEESVGLLLRADALPAPALASLLGAVRDQAALLRAPPARRRRRARQAAATTPPA